MTWNPLPTSKAARTELRVYGQAMRLMGNQFRISVCCEEEEFANSCIAQAVAEIQRIENLLTTFKEDSQTNQINAAAGIAPVRVDAEVFDLVERCQRISALTQGSFDISYGSVDKRLWNFDVSMTSLPNPAIARQSVHLINYRNIILNKEDQTVFLKEKGMRIGFGGIGKGYAAQQARLVLQNLGITSGIVNASGDLTTWGKNPEGGNWTIGIAHPDFKNQPFSYLDISNLAVATSGSYEKFALIDGKQYSHTINPRTGLPVTGIRSVTIICPNSEIADAMATPITIMGVKAGLNLIDQMKDIACIIIDDDNRIHTSRNIQIKTS